MSKILIVGGAGYIGGKTVDVLDAFGYDFWVIDSLLYEDKFLKQVRFQQQDVLDLNIKEINESFDCVVWLAGIVGDAACQVNPTITRAVNVDAVKKLVDNFQGRIIFTSTCSVYGKNSQVCTEETPVNPLSLYGETKYEAEQYILRNRPNTSTVFRLGTVFGMGDNHSRPRFDLIVNNMVRSAIKNGIVSVGEEEQWRPHVHVGDVARSIYRTISAPFYGLYNLVAENTTSRQLADKVVTVVQEAKVVVREGTFEDDRSYRASCDKLKQNVGFHPHRTLQQGIEDVANAIKTGRIKDPYNVLYDNAAYLAKVW